MRRALASRLRPPLGLEVQGILRYGKTGLFLLNAGRMLHFPVAWRFPLPRPKAVKEFVGRRMEYDRSAGLTGLLFACLAVVLEW